MELVDFIEKFAEQFDDVDVEQLSSTTKFRELDGYTSLVALLIITMIDEEYDVTVKVYSVLVLEKLSVAACAVPAALVTRRLPSVGMRSSCSVRSTLCV